MRRVSVVLASFALAATGCSFSSVDPDASVHVSGRALDASGNPLASTRVLLLKQADIGEVVFGTILTVGSLGTLCLVPDPPALCAKARTATTDSDGRYEFDLQGEDTQGTLGTASTMNVVFAGRKASTTVSFTAEDEEISLPDARLWNAAPRVTSADGQFRLGWRDLPSGSRASYSALLYDAAGATAFWTQPARGGSAAVDQRLLEGGRGSVAVGASTKLSGGDGAGALRASYLSPRLAVRSTSGPPPSRGRACAAVTGTGPVRAGRPGRCAITDGDLGEPARLRSAGGVVTGAVVDLGRARPVRLVVGRGFAGQVLVETSTDGRTFQVVGTSSGAAVAVTPGAPPTARYVRLRSPSGLDQSLATEISVW